MHSPIGLLLLGVTSVAATPARLHSVDLPIYQDLDYYMIEIDIGTPSVPHRLLFDTGSSAVWLDSANCTECPNVSGYERRTYNTSASSTGHYTGGFASIEYDGGATEGPIVEDVFRLPGLKPWCNTFLAANQSNWASLPADGFAGFAFPSIEPKGVKTLLQVMAEQNLLPEHKFGIYYGNTARTNASNQGGVFTLGGTKESKYVHGPMVQVPIIKTTYDHLPLAYMVWKADFARVMTTKGHKESIAMPAESAVTFDTGAGQMLLSSNVIDRVYESLGWNYTAILKHEQVLYCHEFNSSWSVSFAFGKDGNSVVTLDGSDLAQPGFPAAPGACWPPFQDAGGNYNIFGAPFLSKLYSTWDLGSFKPADYKPIVSFGQLHK